MEQKICCCMDKSFLHSLRMMLISLLLNQVGETQINDVKATDKTVQGAAFRDTIVEFDFVSFLIFHGPQSSVAAVCHFQIVPECSMGRQ